MTVIIPLLNRSDGAQLRYALRSITTHMPITRCILVGGKPVWYTGDHIPFKDYSPDRKEENIRDKVMAGAEATNSPFLFANDDHILLAPLRCTWNMGLLSTKLSTRIGNGSYTRLLRNTLNHYGDVPNVDCHYPMFMTTDGVRRTLFEWPRFGIGFKTCYAMENGIRSAYCEDMKLTRPADLTGREWFSVGDSYPVRHLHELFPNPSLFEK